ncbi:hypothetical protein JB92DRAFT_2830294 [Gautieria morchelliformis]|nr:hypothetical protein JB92DRAFT_2830294 [Gautieria morchelliformis]
MPGSLRLFIYSSGVRVFAAPSPHGRSELQGASAVPHSALLGMITVAASSIAQSRLLGSGHLLWSLWAVAAAYAVHAELSGMTHRPLPSVTKTGFVWFNYPSTRDGHFNYGHSAVSIPASSLVTAASQSDQGSGDRQFERG